MKILNLCAGLLTAMIMSTYLSNVAACDDPVPPNPKNSRGIYLTEAELDTLPTKGTAWNEVYEVANGNIGRANLADQDNKHGVQTYAVALVAVKTGDKKFYDKARNAIMSAIGTENNRGARTLSIGRSLGAYVIAADIINLKERYPADHNRFSQWLRAIKNKNIGNHGRWVTLQQTHENAANNWGTFAGASRIAISMYLDDKADVARAANIFKAWLGDRSAYPKNAPGKNGYFEKTGDFNASWSCNPAQWTAINKNCSRADRGKDGAAVEDVSRGGAKGLSYTLEAAQGVVVQAELLSNAGYDVWNWENQALKRMGDWMVREGAMNYHSVGYYVPHILNKAYNTKYPTRKAGYGRIMGFTDYTH